VTPFPEGKRVVKWDLDNGQAMKGNASAKILKLIRELQEESSL
jgi:hypothetical protein